MQISSVMTKKPNVVSVVDLCSFRRAWYLKVYALSGYNNFTNKHRTM